MASLDDLAKGHRDAIAVAVKKVFGDPYEKDGVTVIPTARVTAVDPIELFQPGGE